MPPLRTKLQAVAESGDIWLATKRKIANPTSHNAGNTWKRMTRSSLGNRLPRLKKTPVFSAYSRRTVS